MKKIIFSLFLITVVITSCKSQKKQGKSHDQAFKNEVNYIPYYLKVYEADSFYSAKNYEKSFEILDKLFKDYKPLNQDLWYEYETYVKCSVILNKKVSYKYHIEKLVKDFGLNKMSFKGEYEDPLLAKAYLKSGFKDSEFDIMRSQYVKTKNLSLRDTIIKMHKDDQFFRLKGYEKYKKEIDSTDKENEKKMIYIFNKYGFPNSEVIGNRMLRGKPEKTTIHAIVLHMANENNKEYFKNILFTFLKKGKIDPVLYASFIDKQRIDKKEEQFYFTFIDSDLKDLNYAEINNRRKEIGLPTLQYMMIKNKTE